jgi:four helix bundle protein
MRNFRRLEVWQRAFRLALSLQRDVDDLDWRHRFVLGDQLSRAALSIPANIAEGAGRESVKEFRRYLTIALGSSAELENHLLFARELGLIDDATKYLSELSEVQRMLTGLRRGVRS